MGTKLVNITKAFPLHVKRGGKHVTIQIEAGVQALDADIASHWFVKAHCAPILHERDKNVLSLIARHPDTDAFQHRLSVDRPSVSPHDGEQH